ncbi:toxin-antitoxin system HicB family antitoxin [Paeniglutamicibacter sp.]|uniref:toxin-antitoxin system HicB family antitoxin n=1 Tax=Paeniglutamicibacter sp. TaxID=1934391 RepID=UPI00398953B4
MNISRYVKNLQNQLSAAAQASGSEAQEIAERLAPTLDASVRLLLLEVLSDAAAEITTELAPGSVDVRLRGAGPEFVVTVPESSSPAPAAEGAAVPAGPSLREQAEDTESATARLTLRLPEGIKAQVEAAAAREQLSVNTWLVRAVSATLNTPPGASAQRQRNSGHRFTGWVS